MAMRRSVFTAAGTEGGDNHRGSVSFNEERKSRASRFVKGTAIEKPPNNDGDGLMALASHPLNVLLIGFPIGMASWQFGWNDSLTFWMNFFCMVPLAKILGDATEELAAGVKNDMLAGLLNATFGNVVEMVMMVILLNEGKVNLVKETLLGSVLSNLLLVLGMSFFCGGLVGRKLAARPSSKDLATIGQRPSVTEDKQALNNAENTDNKELQESTYEFAGEVVQTFSVMTALVNTSMLLLACLSTSLVTVFASELERRQDGDVDVLIPVSRLCSVIILLAYVAYVFFQLVTHREAMNEAEGGSGGGEAADEDEEDGVQLSIGVAVAVMCMTTIVVSLSSEALVQSVDGVVERAGMPETFIGIILMPIIGNACEHASAIRFAVQNKPGLAIGIAVGSSTQISLFVVPFSVLTGWAIDRPMDLDFGALNTTVMIVSVVVVLSVVVDGTANWLQGYLLVSAYLVVAVLYWHLPSADQLSADVTTSIVG